MKSIRLFLLLLGLVITFLAACSIGTPRPAGAIVDDLGRSVNVKEVPQRIISLAPSNTEILFALGLGDRVVGVTDFCDYPPEALEKEKIGGPFLNIDIEKIVALEPDLILAADINPIDVINTLEGQGFTVFGIEATDLDDLLDDINTVGTITGKEVEATTLTDDMRSKIGAITIETTNLSPEEKPRMFHICWHDPIYTSGNGTFIHDVIEKAGGVNIFADLEGYKSVDIEAVIFRDPEVIIVTAMGGTAGPVWDWINTDERLKVVAARKNGRIYYIESNWVERPGPRVVLGLEAMAKCLHPEFFGKPKEVIK